MIDFKKILDNSKAVMAGVVGLLIVIPSVINSIGDIITSLRNLPIGEKEKMHVELMDKHWKENPIYTKQMKISELVITLDIYENGDIWVDYGEYAQWFPYKKIGNSKDKELALSFFTNLYADDTIDNHKLGGITTEIENIKSKNNVIRIRKFSDGSTQKITLNKNTGKILKIDINQSKNSSIDNNMTIETIIETIDLSKKAVQSKGLIEVIKLPSK